MPDAILDGTGFGYPCKVNQDGSINTNSSLSIYQVVSGNTNFIAKAEPGMSLGSASWQMSKQTSLSVSGNNVMQITWASGNGLFNKIADDILTSPYS